MFSVATWKKEGNGTERVNFITPKHKKVLKIAECTGSMQRLILGVPSGDPPKKENAD